mgnify:CR=1 FL=1
MLLFQCDENFIRGETVSPDHAYGRQVHLCGFVAPGNLLHLSRANQPRANIGMCRVPNCLRTAETIRTTRPDAGFRAMSIFGHGQEEQARTIEATETQAACARNNRIREEGEAHGGETGWGASVGEGP